MKKYDIRTRQGRASRHSRSDQFNPNTLQPHSRSYIEMRRKAGLKD